MNAPSRSSADTARPGSDEQDAPASPAPPQGERHTRTLMELLACCEAWEPDVRILGNVSAEDAADAIRASLRASPAVPVAQDERELPPLPEPFEVMELWGQNVNVYDAGKMRDYARAALSAATQPDAAEAEFLCNLSQMLNAVEQDWKIAGHWSEWDQRVIEEFCSYKARRLAATPPAAVPPEVLAALDRMCTPLDESWLKGATAEADAHCMKLIRDYVLGAAQPAVSAEAREWTQEQLDAMTHDAMVDALRDRGDDPLSREVANALAYFIAQDGLLGKAEREAEKLAAELAETKRPLEEQMARLNKRVTELNADAARLDWLDATNKRFRMGWKVGVAPAGNCSVQAIIMGGQSIREAIDAAMAPPAEGEQK